MDPLLQWAQKHQREVTSLIRQFVECESPSDSPADVARFLDLVAESGAGLATPMKSRGALFLKFKLPGRNKSGRILALGHGDTVWPLGTLRTMKFREAEGRLWGPGVLDMKAGIAFFLFAMRAIRDLDLPVAKDVLLLVTPDEETGSRASRAVIEQTAKQSGCVLVLEPGTGLEGKVKTARKGIGDFHLRVEGVAAHSGVDFEKGASAILELARQIQHIGGFTSLMRGITVNPGVISGGTRSNVIAAEADAHIDIRVRRLRDAAILERKFQRLKPFDKRCKLTITGGLNRPPMERTKAIADLFRLARREAAALGIDLQESSTGGGSDGNFTAALGIPTLDGVGAVGEGAHASHESILTDRIADRIALLAKLVIALS
ncbi:MAG TPA: M20 family metallopeptidase [Bryobacteraceae bacterium]|nr:M20 family metallopeptidase [Bryobacteraceae bacterium]